MARRRRYGASARSGPVCGDMRRREFCGAAPWTSGGIGPFDLAVRETAVAFGAATVGATAYVIILHALLLIPVAAVGAALLWRRHLLAR